MSALPETRLAEPITAWRCWRILPYETLDGEQSVRLCAVGTLAGPKVWEPRQANAAICASYDSHHAAPWFDHECGVWALRDRATAYERMEGFVETQGSDLVGWAFGQVSLWGLVIEHEHGYRAQFAYPYSISVESTDESLAGKLARLYLVDAEWAGSELGARVLDDDQEDTTPRSVFDDIREELDAIKQALTTMRAQPVRTRSAATERPKQRYVDYWLRDSVEAVTEALAKAIEKNTLYPAARARRVAEEMTPSTLDRGGMTKAELMALPLHNGAEAVAPTLKRAAVMGKVVQLRQGNRGTSLWTLPDVPLDHERLKGYKPVEDTHAAFDREVLKRFKAALNATKAKSARVRDVLAHEGRDYRTVPLGEKVKMAHALGRLVLKGKVQSAATRPVEAWSLSS
jgi:hypothetical protein